MNSELTDNPAATINDITTRLIETGSWVASRQANKYLGFNIGSALSNYRVLGTSIEAAVKRMIVESNVSTVFLSAKFQGAKLNDETIKYCMLKFYLF